MIFQGVDEHDKNRGPLEEKDLPSSIHRRVALALLDENNTILITDDGNLPHCPIEYGNSSESTARLLLAEYSSTHSALDPLGGILQLRDEYSTQTHIFLVRWSGPAPQGLYREPLPLEKKGLYTDFVNRSLARGKHRPLHIREDLRS